MVTEQLTNKPRTRTYNGRAIVGKPAATLHADRSHRIDTIKRTQLERIAQAHGLQTFRCGGALYAVIQLHERVQEDDFEHFAEIVPVRTVRALRVILGY